MSPEPSAHQSSLKELTGTAIRQLAAGASQEKLIGQLIARGWPEVSARHFIANIAQTAQHHNDVDEDRENVIEACRRRIMRDMILGVLSFTMMMLAISLFASFSFISLVFLGMSAYALIDMVIAFITYLRIRR